MNAELRCKHEARVGECQECAAELAAGAVYDADYYLRGRETGKSLYENYRWLPELTVPMACAMVRHLDVRPDHTVLDFGCARGYTVRALRELGYNAWGHDISQWALANADEQAKQFLIANSSAIMAGSFDWVISKDTLEHVPQVTDIVTELMDVARVGVFAVVPLSEADGEKYTILSYEKDVTHVHRLALASWVRMFVRPGWTVEASYRVRGIKDNYWRPGKYMVGNGFITARRME